VINKWGYSLLLSLVLLSGGCMSTAQAPATLYTLNPDLSAIQAPVEQAAANKTSIKLARMNSMQALDRPNILYVTTGHQQNSYAYSHWSKAPTAMLLSLMQQALETSNQFGAVLPPASRARPDLVLESTLFDFSHHINDDGTSSGMIRLSVNLVDNRTKRVVSNRLLEANVPAAKQNAESAVEALNIAAAQVIQQLLAWLGEEQERARSSDAGS
jgi:cholesterol transport system auxiliary component